MPGLSFLVGLSAVLSCWIPLASAVLPTWLPHVAERATGSLDTFIASERSRALQGVLDNIGAGGSKVPAAEPGLVVASPSKEDPNCRSLFSCTLHILWRILCDRPAHANGGRLVAHLAGRLLSRKEDSSNLRMLTLLH